ncbi:hypothetical protein E3N88_41525 [Mikania micrantha]|uniref:Guanosine nucleotide diphosphate dissociation inhibitor n=1 Tax=Mikania micrantha TaxID=192012 RepID=A0A5N6LMN8_9ASTR|nr:hypothetical protein E3N88_41525 [Mikania micrantha]
MVHRLQSKLLPNFCHLEQRISLICKYGLDDNTVDFIGHALALHRDDRYLNEPALDTVKRMKLYAESLARFQGGSPYIYPLYGLGELPQAFARLSAVYGGTYMLNKPECKVEFDEEGKVCGVTSEGETAKCKKVVCDPSYLPNKVRKVGKVARAICIMSHPIPNTNDSHSVQVILPQKQLGRKSDMYLFCCSYSHNVAPKGKFIAFVSTEAESDQPEVELKPGLDLLGPVDEIFYDVYDRYEPVNEPSLDNCFISTSYDATTHFESTVIDVLNMYSMITGKGFNRGCLGVVKTSTGANSTGLGSKSSLEAVKADWIGRRGQTHPKRKLSSTVMKIDEGEIIEEHVSALKGDDGNKDLTRDVTGWDCKAEQRTREESERLRLQERGETDQIGLLTALVLDLNVDLSAASAAEE